MSAKNNGTSDSLDFIAPIMVYYLNSVRQFQCEANEKSSLDNILDDSPSSKTTHKFSLENLKEFMGVAPSLHLIKKGIKIMQPKEVIIYKILLDILGSYLRLFFGADSKQYRKYLDTVICFYQKVSEADLAKVVNILMHSLSHLDKGEQTLLMRRFVTDIVCLPQNDTQRINIVMG
jgi:hypothetical protein